MRTMLKFYLISRCENFVERRSFRRVSGELCGNYAFLQNFQTRKLGEIKVFYVVVHKKFRRRSLNILHCKKKKKFSEISSQFSVDLVTFAEEILNEKLYFLCGVMYDQFDNFDLSEIKFNGLFAHPFSHTIVVALYLSE